jgi:hypothetical protein
MPRVKIKLRPDKAIEFKCSECGEPIERDESFTLYQNPASEYDVMIICNKCIE